MLTPFLAVNPAPVVNTSQNEFMLNKTAWILEQNFKNSPFVSPKNSPFPKELPILYAKSDHPKWK